MGSVIASLLTTVGHEYEEAVIHGSSTLRLPGLLASPGLSPYDTIAADVEAAAPEEAAEIEEAFEVLAAALPGPEAPETLASR